MLSLVACLILALAGFLTFVEKTKGNVLNNFPSVSLLNLTWIASWDSKQSINRITLSSTLLVFVSDWTCSPHYPWSCLFVGRLVTLLDCTSTALSHNRSSSSFSFRTKLSIYKDMYSSQRSFFLLQCSVSSTGNLRQALINSTVALITCDLGVMLEITGGISATALAFIFPAACYITLVDTKASLLSRKKLPAVICVGFGTFVMVISLVLALRNMGTKAGNVKLCDWTERLSLEHGQTLIREMLRCWVMKSNPRDRECLQSFQVLPLSQRFRRHWAVTP